MKVVNLTHHEATPEQKVAGVEDVSASMRDWVRRQLTFDGAPTVAEIRRRARELARTAAKALGADAVMIGGAPWFMAELERALFCYGVKPLYAFSRRETVEEKAEDGSVRKTTVFRHKGFVEPPVVLRDDVETGIYEEIMDIDVTNGLLENVTVTYDIEGDEVIVKSVKLDGLELSAEELEAMGADMYAVEEQLWETERDRL